MEEFNAASFAGKDDFESGLLKNDKPLLDMDDFETLESALNATNDSPIHTKDLIDDLSGNLQSGLISTTRPLVTSSEDEVSESSRGVSPSIPSPNLLDYVNIDKDQSLIDIKADTGVEDTIRHSAYESPPQQQHFGGGDSLLIDDDKVGLQPVSEEDKSDLIAGLHDDRQSAYHFEEIPQSKNIESVLEVKEPKIDSKTERYADSYESGLGAYQAAAQPAVVKKTEVAMEAEKVGSTTKSSEDCICPYSPGAWFNPDKLHPVVAQYVYWRDPKKSGIALAISLTLLLSFKYYSIISVTAYLTLALLTITTTFRIYKNILQAVQKSNEGHPFKDYLEMDITLSQDKVSETVEVLIHHLNCVSGKIRSLILVEDLVDTIKLGVLAWCMTYIGAWFNGLTLIIIFVISAFTMPKVYETNKAQIDMYAELVCTKGKEVIEMVNAKMPLGKKKKDQ
ncbi:reticulon-3 [Parasteatoda tepidariorum]|uniref:reticulon-3 n=1 Tax=Parasteatoda tepidariorum TaxID=114398 RepID=UPI00077FAB47|nr:reticulon-3 [Parasteatoda tepidariorum]